MKRRWLDLWHSSPIDREETYFSNLHGIKIYVKRQIWITSSFLVDTYYSLKNALSKKKRQCLIYFKSWVLPKFVNNLKN